MIGADFEEFGVSELNREPRVRLYCKACGYRKMSELDDPAGRREVQMQINWHDQAWHVRPHGLGLDGWLVMVGAGVLSAVAFTILLGLGWQMVQMAWGF